MTVKHAHQTALPDTGSDVSANEWNADHSITTDLSPDTTDAASLGTTSKMWSDLFLASGGVIDWNNGANTLTQSGSDLIFNAGASSLAVKATGATASSPRIQIGLTTDTFARINFGLDSSDNPNFGLGGGGAGTRDVFISRVSAGIMQVGTSSTNSAGTLKAAVFNGVGGTVTASTPLLDMTQTWNNAAVTFTALKLNATVTASDNSGYLLDLQRGGASQFNVSEFGVTNAATFQQIGNNVYITDTGIVVGSGKWIGFAPTSASSQNPDTYITRDAAYTIAQKNSTNAQTMRVYNTYTDASNYERLVFDWTTNANVCTVKSEAAGTGTWRPVVLHRAGFRSVSADITMSAGDNYIIMNKAATTASVTLMTASAAMAGRELYVKNFGSTAIVSGGASANVVPLAGGATAQAIVAGTAGKYAKLYCDGTTWHIMEAN